jgi:hypothetical protein
MSPGGTALSSASKRDLNSVSEMIGVTRIWETLLFLPNIKSADSSAWKSAQVAENPFRPLPNV